MQPLVINNSRERYMEFTVNIENFRSIKSTRLRLRSGVNILIGPNGSGKTCLLSALKFICDVMFQGAGLAIARGGGPLRTYRRGESQIRFSIEHTLGKRVYQRRKMPFRLRWEIVISQKGSENSAAIVCEHIIMLALNGQQERKVFELEIDRQNIAKPKHRLYIAPPH
jgi:predicted ATPase